jgi:hypothetical protein
MRKKRFHGRIDWDKPANLIPLHVAVEEYPFHGKVLAKMTGLSVGQVYYRLRQHGVSLRDLRDGAYGHGADVRSAYTVTNAKVKLMVPAMTKTHAQYLDAYKKGLKHGKKKKQKTA